MTLNFVSVSYVCDLPYSLPFSLWDLLNRLCSVFFSLFFFHFISFIQSLKLHNKWMGRRNKKIGRKTQLRKRENGNIALFTIPNATSVIKKNRFSRSVYVYMRVVGIQWKCIGEKGVTRCLKALEVHSTVYWSSGCCNPYLSIIV